jgi:hypothetical protein
LILIPRDERIVTEYDDLFNFKLLRPAVFQQAALNGFVPRAFRHEVRHAGRTASRISDTYQTQPRRSEAQIAKVDCRSRGRQEYSRRIKLRTLG